MSDKLKLLTEWMPLVYDAETIQENNSFYGFGQIPKEFEDMFPKYKEKGRSLGSGVIVDKDNGYIITNNHVVENAESIKVVLYDDRELNAEIIGTHKNTDLAVIKIEAVLCNFKFYRS